MEDLNQAITLQEKAVHSTPENHPDLPSWLNALGNSLDTQYTCLGNLEDLNRAITLYEKAIQSTPEDHPKLAIWLKNLGNSLRKRFDLLNNMDDLTLAEKQFFIAVNIISASPHSRLESAICWAQCDHLISPQKAHHSYSYVMQLFSEAISLSISINDRHFWLAKNTQHVRDAVQNALQCAQIDLAIEWFEQGQSVVWTQFLQLRPPLEELRNKYPLLAEQLEDLSSWLDQASTQDYGLQGIDISQDHIQITNTIGSERVKLLKNIRMLPGFTRFLLPKEVSDLKRLSRMKSPIILINLSQFNCDALALSCSSIQHIPLPEFDYKDAKSLYTSLLDILAHKNIKQRSGRAIKITSPDNVNYDLVFERMLSQLWEQIAKPILRALGIIVCILQILIIVLY